MKGLLEVFSTNNIIHFVEVSIYELTKLRCRIFLRPLDLNTADVAQCIGRDAECFFFHLVSLAWKGASTENCTLVTQRSGAHFFGEALDTKQALVKAKDLEGRPNAPHSCAPILRRYAMEGYKYFAFFPGPDVFFPMTPGDKVLDRHTGAVLFELNQEGQGVHHETSRAAAAVRKVVGPVISVDFRRGPRPP